MVDLAKSEWEKGHILKAGEYWWLAVRLTVKDTLNEKRAREYLRQSDDFLQQGKLIDALNACYTAARIYDQEGATTYRCLEIEQLIYGTPTPFPEQPR